MWQRPPPVISSPREGDQFRGATVGHRCLDQQADITRYVEFQVLIGQDLYWYRRRILRKSDGEVQEEIMGFNWFELNTTQLYTCRVDWTSNDHPQDLRPLLKLDVQDQGGHGRFVTPDGRKSRLPCTAKTGRSRPSGIRSFSSSRIKARQSPSRRRGPPSTRRTFH